jgi:hypothetical protein
MGVHAAATLPLLNPFLLEADKKEAAENLATALFCPPSFSLEHEQSDGNTIKT